MSQRKEYDGSRRRYAYYDIVEVPSANDELLDFNADMEPPD